MMRRNLPVALAAVVLMWTAGAAQAQTTAQKPGWPSNPVLDGPFQRGDYAEVHRLAAPLAAEGDGYAEHLIGLMYERGWGVPRDAATAVGWYRKAAEKGVVAAQNNLAGCLTNGMGVARNFEEAAVWYQKAADGGALQAQFNLAQFYYRGLGVKQDYKRAAELYRDVAANVFVD